MQHRFFILGFFLAALNLQAQAFESDVHFGLTKWLALKSGFTEAQAEAVATGNQRTDAGMMDSIELVLEYACLEKHLDAAKVAQTYHFASASKLPASPTQRVITAGSPASRRAVDAVMASAGNDKAAFMLLRFGEGLHLLQDSWAYQGTPDTPEFDDPALRCDPTLAWAAPAARGGWNSHRPDLAKAWPDDTKAMALASYQYLKQYPKIAGQTRVAAEWDALLDPLTGFLQATSKVQKKHWFNAQGIADTTFLDGISLPDGKGWNPDTWSGRRLPQLKSSGSTQYGVAIDARNFYDNFFTQWLASDSLNKSLDGALGQSIGLQRQPDLRVRLKIWRLRDHGSVADLAHAQASLTRAQVQTVEALQKNPAANVRYANLADAFFPLLQQGPGVSPLLPYVIHTLAPSKDGNPRAIAVTKLRHVPYDELGFIAENTKGGWKVVRLVTAVNH
jgi:hypothetical protein